MPVVRVSESASSFSSANAAAASRSLFVAGLMEQSGGGLVRNHPEHPSGKRGLRNTGQFANA